MELHKTNPKCPKTAANFGAASIPNGICPSPSPSPLIPPFPFNPDWDFFPLPSFSFLPFSSSNFLPIPPPLPPPRFTRDDGSLLLAHFLQPTKKEGRAQIHRLFHQFPSLLHFPISASSKGAMRLLDPPLIGPIGSLALLAAPTLAPSSPSPSSSHPLLPPFNARDSRLVASCALRAQQKQRQNQNEGQGTRAWSLWARLGMGPGQSPPPVHGLPIRQVRYEHPHRRGALFCRTGNWLELVEGEGGDRGSPVKVKGTRRQSGRFTVFEFLAVAFGLVSIRASANQHFLCMDANGQLYAAPESQYSAECVFMEEMHPQVYNLYSSCAHGPPRRPWFVALSKTGRPRRGRGTRRGQKSAHFVLVEGRGGENGGEGGRNEGGGGNANAVLDSLGHAQSRADWLVHWRNFYEVHERRKKKRPPPALAKGRSGRLRWEIETGSELRRRRRIGVG